MQVALKLLPDTNMFINLLMAKGEHFDILREEIQALVSLLLPLVQDLHSILVSSTTFIYILLDHTPSFQNNL